MKYKIAYFLKAWLTLPHLVVYCFSRNKALIRRDVEVWKVNKRVPERLGISTTKKRTVLSLSYLLAMAPEFRNLFYLRVGTVKFLLYYLRPLSSLYLNTPSGRFGTGNYFNHGFSTIINAKSVGNDCYFCQQVTVGTNVSRKYGIGEPAIGNHVYVGAGAIIIGPITVGDYVTIGANCVVAKDIPAHSTVYSAPVTVVPDESGGVL